MDIYGWPVVTLWLCVIAYGIWVDLRRPRRTLKVMSSTHIRRLLILSGVGVLFEWLPKLFGASRDIRMVFTSLAIATLVAIGILVFRQPAEDDQGE